MRGSKRERRPGVWELRVHVGRDPSTGRDRYRSRTVHGGKRAADRALAELVAEVTRARPSSSATFAELVEAWLELAERDLSPTTLRTYRSIADKRVLPALGDVPVERLTARDLDGLYIAASREVSPASVRRIHALCRRALAQGVRWGWVAENVAVLASPPPVRQREVVPPTLAQMAAVVAAAPAFDPDLAVIVAVAAGTGLRRGELCGLRWSDVDLDGAELVVRRAVVEVAGRVTIKGTKTHQIRRLALSEGLVGVLGRHREAVLERARISEAGWAEDPYVWSRALDASEPLRPGLVTKGWVALCRSVGVEGVRFHDLRHLHATTLIDAGVPVTTVAARLGHAQVSTTTNIYAHAVRARDVEAAAVMDRWMDGARSGLGAGDQ